MYVVDMRAPTTNWSKLASLKFGHHFHISIQWLTVSIPWLATLELVSTFFLQTCSLSIFLFNEMYLGLMTNLTLGPSKYV